MVYDRAVNNELIIKTGWEISLGIHEEGMISLSESKNFNYEFTPLKNKKPTFLTLESVQATSISVKPIFFL